MKKCFNGKKKPRCTAILSIEIRIGDEKKQLKSLDREELLIALESAFADIHLLRLRVELLETGDSLLSKHISETEFLERANKITKEIEETNKEFQTTFFINHL